MSENLRATTMGGGGREKSKEKKMEILYTLSVEGLLIRKKRTIKQIGMTSHSNNTQKYTISPSLV